MCAAKPNDEIIALREEICQLKAEVRKAKLSERRFLDALRLSPMALCHHDRELRYTWLYNGHMGFVQDDVIGLTDWDILDKDLADRMGLIKGRVLETGVGERVEMPTVAGDEDSEYFDLVVEPLVDVDTREIIGLSCSGIDVTEDRRRREAYKASEENLRFIFNATPMPIVVTHFGSGQVLFSNRLADRFFNLERCEDVLGWLGVRKRVEQSLEQGEALHNMKFNFVNEQAQKLYMTVSATKIFYDGEPAILSIFHDLTQEAEHQRKLEEAKEKAELASIAKSQFLASASHDLRQPLHAMGLLLSVLEQHIDTPGGLKVLDRVTSSLETMNELFAGILDISKLDANAVPVKMETVDVKRCFEVLEREFSTVAASKELELRFVPSSAFIKSDPVQLDRILRNLIANALRYTEKGKILVGTRRKGDRLYFYVCDTGIGISPENQKIIFQEFRQVGNPERDRRKGLGLGLAICERIADLLMTKIELTSTLSKGSVFWFSVPLILSDKDRQSLAHYDQNVSLVGKCVLFIEDEVDVQIATQYMLEAWECDPMVCGSMEEALDFCLREMRRPDVIVADYRLRDNANGLDAVLKLREKLGADIPAIVLSGDTAPELIRELECHGLTLLNKPLMPKELREALSSLVSEEIIAIK